MTCAAVPTSDLKISGECQNLTVQIAWGDTFTGVFVPLHKLENGLLGLRVWSLFWDLGSEMAGNSLRQKTLESCYWLSTSFPPINQQAHILSIDKNPLVCHLICVLTLPVLSAQITRSDLHLANICQFLPVILLKINSKENICAQSGGWGLETTHLVTAVFNFWHLQLT